MWESWDFSISLTSPTGANSPRILITIWRLRIGEANYECTSSQLKFKSFSKPKRSIPKSSTTLCHSDPHFQNNFNSLRHYHIDRRENFPEEKKIIFIFFLFFSHFSNDPIKTIRIHRNSTFLTISASVLRDSKTDEKVRTKKVPTE